MKCPTCARKIEGVIVPEGETVSVRTSMYGVCDHCSTVLEIFFEPRVRVVSQEEIDAQPEEAKQALAQLMEGLLEEEEEKGRPPTMS